MNMRARWKQWCMSIPMWSHNRNKHNRSSLVFYLVLSLHAFRLRHHIHCRTHQSRRDPAKAKWSSLRLTLKLCYSFWSVHGSCVFFIRIENTQLPCSVFYPDKKQNKQRGHKLAENHTFLKVFVRKVRFCLMFLRILPLWEVKH